MEHEDIPLNEIHIAHNWEFADAAEREAADISDDRLLKRLAIQLDDKSFWVLTGISPVAWVAVGGPVKADAIALAAHEGDDSNPHSVTKAQVGLSSVDNTSDADKPISTAAQAALDAKEGTIAAGATTQYWRGDKSWQTLDKSAVGLGNVDNTSDANKPVSTATQSAIDAKADASTLALHTSATNNPHSVTKAQVGLANVDNTSDTNKPISTATQTALDAKEASITAGTTAQYWRGDKSWQTLNKSAVGLANVDNTSDANKPISTATQTALNAKEGTVAAGATTQYWRGDKSWQTLDKSAVGLGNVDNTSDLNKPISTATQTALDAKAADASLSAHTANTSNPHGVTKAQVGLSNVDNTSDAAKPVSTATQTALDAKATVAALAAHTGDMNNPHGVDKTDVGLGNVDNTSDINKPVSTAQAAADTSTLNQAKAYTDSQVLGIFRDRGNYDASSNVFPSTGGSGAAGAIQTGDLWNITVGGTLGGESVDPRQTVRALVNSPGQTSSNWAIGLGNADIEDAINDGVTGRAPSQNAVFDALALKASTAALSSHTANTSNPHSVTKSQVGLANVDNTSDLNKPISTATQTALNAKEGTITAGTTAQYWRGDKSWSSFAADVRATVLTGIDITVNAVVSATDSVLSALGKLQKQITDNLTTLNSHTSNTSNPHSTTKAQVGLANVDNTSDVNKPISTATQTALNAKEGAIASGTTAQYWRGDKSWQALDKSAVGLANVDNTSDANKPISTATQTALNAKEPTVAAGTTAQYWRGDKSWQALNFAALSSHPTTTSGYGITNAVTTDAGGLVAATGFLGATVNSNASIAALPSADIGLEVRGNGTGAAVILLYRPSSYAAFLGLDTDNQLRFGGWSVGAVAHKVWHSGNVVAADIPSLDWSKITTGKPTTLAGYGITDAETKVTAGTTAQYWRGDKSWQTLDKAAVGLVNVDNTSDANKPISTATQTALNAKEPTVAAGTTAQYWRGDKSWQTLDKSAVGLANVDNTSDANKSISTATQTALNAKEATIAAGATTQYWRGDKSWQTLDKSAVGLGNVDNTSDANKPISTATQTALDAKADASTAVTKTGAQTLTNKTLVSPVIWNMTEGCTSATIGAGGTFVIDLGFGPGNKVTLNGSGTIQLPAASPGKRVYVDVVYGVNGAAPTFSVGGTGGTVKYSANTPPTTTGVTGRTDRYSFIADIGGANFWYCKDEGRNFV